MAVAGEHEGQYLPIAEHELVEGDGGVLFRGAALTLALESDREMSFDGHDVAFECTLEAGDWMNISLSRVDPGYEPRRFTEGEATEAFTHTVSFWRNWIAKSRYRGRWREMVHRSALTLKLLTYAPTGALVAAPTSRSWCSPTSRATWAQRRCASATAPPTSSSSTSTAS